MSVDSFNDIFSMFMGGRYETALDRALEDITLTPRERLRQQYAAVWEAGFEAAQAEYLAQERDPAHPFTRKNPWKKDR